MNINTRNMEFLKFNNEEMQWAKFNGVTIYEAWKKLWARGIPPLTLQKCKGVDLVDYKIYGNSVQGKLPSEYQQVEYIESTGTQYIDTGVIPNNETGLKIKLSLPEIINDTFRFGCRQDTGNTRFILGSQDSVAYFGFGNLIHPRGTGYWIINENVPFTASLNYLNSRTANINNLNNQNVSNISINFTYSLIMFGRNSSGTITSSAQKVYSCEITNGNEIVRDFIPCYRKSDNVIGMYDLVENKFYTNAGTGTFLKGNNAPTPEAPIEIESVGDKTKNLFDMTKNVGFGTKNGLTITYSNEEDCLIINGTSTVETSYFSKDFLIPNVAGTSYGLGCFYISGTIDKPSGKYTSAYFGQSDNGVNRSNWKSMALQQGQNSTYVATCDSLYIMGFWIWISAGVTFNNYKFRVQLEKSTEKPTSYDTYNKYKIPVKISGKNKLCVPKETVTTTTYNANFTLSNVDGKVKIEGIPFPDYYTYVSLNETFNITTASGSCNKVGKTIVPKNTPFVFSWKNENPNPEVKFSYIMFIYDDGTRYGVSMNYDNGYVKVTARTQNIANIYIRFKTSNTQQDIEFNDLYSFQIEYGTNVTEYEPYYEPVITNIYLNEPLRKIGDYADYIDFEKQKVIRKVKETILTGEEKISWTVLSQGTAKEFYRYKITNEDIVLPKGTTHEGQFCNYLPAGNITTSNSVIGMSVYYSESQGFTFFRCRFPSGTITNGIETYLKELYASGNPMKYYFATSEIKEETIDLPIIATHKGTTIIEVDTSISPSNMEVEYYAKGVS